MIRMIFCMILFLSIQIYSASAEEIKTPFGFKRGKGGNEP